MQSIVPTSPVTASAFWKGTSIALAGLMAYLPIALIAMFNPTYLLSCTAPMSALFCIGILGGLGVFARGVWIAAKAAAE